MLKRAIAMLPAGGCTATTSGPDSTLPFAVELLTIG
jgi:hypothetical protein